MAEDNIGFSSEFGTVDPLSTIYNRHAFSCALGARERLELQFKACYVGTTVAKPKLVLRIIA